MLGTLGKILKNCKIWSLLFKSLICYLGRLHDIREIENVQIKALIYKYKTFSKLFNCFFINNMILINIYFENVYEV